MKSPFIISDATDLDSAVEGVGDVIPLTNARYSSRVSGGWGGLYAEVSCPGWDPGRGGGGRTSSMRT